MNTQAQVRVVPLPKSAPVRFINWELSFTDRQRHERARQESALRRGAVRALPSCFGELT